MTLSLHTLKPAPGSKKSAKRVGRGLGSKGTYSGRGVKGQRARSGGRAGLQLKGIRALMLKIPKQRGFGSQHPKPAVVNLEALAKHFKDGAIVTPQALEKKGLIAPYAKAVKILGKGDLTVKLTVKKCAASASAKEKIEKAGGSVTL
jgi:large subunit ribosomal protein L15